MTLRHSFYLVKDFADTMALTGTTCSIVAAVNGNKTLLIIGIVASIFGFIGMIAGDLIHTEMAWLNRHPGAMPFKFVKKSDLSEIYDESESETDNEPETECTTFNDNTSFKTINSFISAFFDKVGDTFTKEDLLSEASTSLEVNTTAKSLITALGKIESGKYAYDRVRKVYCKK